MALQLSLLPGWLEAVEAATDRALLWDPIRQEWAGGPQARSVRGLVLLRLI